MSLEITLGNCSSFLLTMLGDFCSQNGMDAKTQKDYKDENTKSAYGKYNLADGKSILSKTVRKFYKKIYCDYNEITDYSYLMVRFPLFLQKSIKHYDPRINEYFSGRQVIVFFLSQYIAYHYKNIPYEAKKLFKDFIRFHSSWTYNAILKNTKLNIKALNENCKWSSLQEILEIANNSDIYDNKDEKIFDCMRLIQHYLFLGFKKALRDVFNFADEEIQNLEVWLFENIDAIVQSQNFYIENFSHQFYEYMRLPFDNSENVIFSLFNIDCDAIKEMFFTEQEWMNKELKEGLNHRNEMFRPCLKDEAVFYFINSNTKITKQESEEWIKELESLNDDYYNKVVIPWYKARTAIFSLTFTDKAKDKELKETACNLFRDTFNNYKYLIGKNLEEFLSDAIVCDVYYNPKKDIFGNTQDNTDESSIIMPGKAYWEFGYALNVFDEDSKKTYLLTFNAEQNFWTNFPPTKFKNQEVALEAFCTETKNSEFEFPILLKNFTDPIKIDNLGSSNRKDLRQPLGNRYYSNLSIRCLKANGAKNTPNEPSDFIYIRNYINKNKDNTDLLFTNDENGANALIRSLNRCKMLSYGYTDADLVERARMYSEYYANWYQKQYFYVAKNAADSGLSETQSDKGLNEYLKKVHLDFINQSCAFYTRVAKSAKNTKTEREEIQSEIKEKIILPLIKIAGNRLLDEAILLDGKKCVSALQIAIDSFDYEIVKEIVENLPSETDLSRLLISSEYVTTLQYAIRKYDYLMQYSTMIFSKSHKIGMLEKRAIHSRKKIDKGVLKYDKDFYASNDMISKFVESSPTEECGLGLIPLKDEANKNILSVQQKNLIAIIKFLAQKTNPISVDTFYYLADQIDSEDGHVFADVFDITEILIETGHADLTGTDFEWSRYNPKPTQTLLAYCINHPQKNEVINTVYDQKNYDMLAFLLSKYPEKFKPSINRLILGFDNDGNKRYDTDLHFLITNLIESIKAWNNPKYAYDKKMFEENFRKSYGRQLAQRMNIFLTLFKNAGARFDIPDQDGKSVKDLLMEWKDKMPEGAIPEGILD